MNADPLPAWQEGTAKRSTLAFLRDVTRGAGAIPPAERVAAFDFDGTVACEKPRTALAAFLADRSGPCAAPSPDSGHDVLAGLALVFAGSTVADYDEQSREFLTGAVHPRFGCSYPSLTYQPMLELFALLRALEFSIFVCTDSSRDFLRAIAEPVLGLRREQIIGSEVQIEFRNGQLVRTAALLPLDDGPGKTVHLWDRTGAKPILAAGNAAGDVAMLGAAQHALVVRHDDAVREYAYDDEEILAAASSNNWTVLSMRTDFARLWAES